MDNGCNNTYLSAFIRTLLFVLILSVVAVCIDSCRYIKYRSDNVIAKTGNYTLYKSDIQSIIPKGVSVEDSLLMLEKYVNAWAIKSLMLHKAEESLSKEEKDVKDELEEYRASLLLYKFEEKYVTENLDTTVSEDECKQFYKDHPESFALSTPIVKAAFIKISNSSPNLEKIRSLFLKSNNQMDSSELELICKHSADKYSNFNNEWIDLSLIANEVLSDGKVCEKEASKLSYIDEKDELFRYFAVFRNYLKAGETAPYEFCAPKIKGTILARRKRELLRNLEEITIKEAKEKNLLKIYIKPKS